MTNLAVHLAGVSKRYPHFTLDNVRITLPTGSVMGFIGANGAGKSTTIRMLMGLVHQDQGSVRILDYERPAESRSSGRCMRARRSSPRKSWRTSQST